MIDSSFRLTALRGVPRAFLTAFLITLSAGYLAGIYFVDSTTGNTPEGVQQQFRGNEDQPMESVTEIKFPKSTREMLTIIHTHVTSFALIFFCVGGLFLFTQVSAGIKYFLVVEPFAATLLLFGGMAGVRFLPAAWAPALAIVMMLAGITTFAALLLMVGIMLYEMWRSRPLRGRS